MGRLQEMPRIYFVTYNLEHLHSNCLQRALKGYVGDGRNGRQGWSCSCGQSNLIQREAFAQVHSPHFRILSQLFRRAGAENLSFVDDVGPVGHRQRLPHIVVGD